MNEKIKELAEQAGIGYGKPSIENEDVLYIQSDKIAGAISTDADEHQQKLIKFALLVVQECAKVCKDHKEMYAMLAESDVTFAAMTTAASVCATDIEKMFVGNDENNPTT